MQKNNDIKLSVIIPSYNYAGFISKAVVSIIDQNMPVHEIIIIDDGSEDDTKGVVETLQNIFTEFNIRYFYQENYGVSTARNNGFRQSTGDYLLFLDADDRLLPGSLEVVYAEINSQPNVDMIFGGYQAISYSGELRIRTPIKLQQNRMKNVATLLDAQMVGLRPSSSVLKRHVLEKIDFPTDVHIDEDTMFFSRVLYHFECISIPNILVEMPRHSDSLRENYERIIETGVHGIEELFASLPFDDEGAKLKKRVLIKRYLKMGRMACKNQDYKIASHSYMSAAKLGPSSVLNLKHFPRMIKSLIMS